MGVVASPSLMAPQFEPTPIKKKRKKEKKISHENNIIIIIQVAY